jgi:hypothetical protein
MIVISQLSKKQFFQAQLSCFNDIIKLAHFLLSLALSLLLSLSLSNIYLTKFLNKNRFLLLKNNNFILSKLEICLKFINGMNRCKKG